MEDLRHRHCGPDHIITPSLEVLQNFMTAIDSAAKEVENSAASIDMVNYGGRAKEIGDSARMIAISARSAMAELDKLIMIDIGLIANKQKECV